MSTPTVAEWSRKKDKNKSKRRTYRIKGTLPHFIKRGRMAELVVQEQEVLLLSRSDREYPDNLEFDPDYDRYVTIPAGHELQTFDSGRPEGQSFFIANVIDGKPGDRMPSVVFQLTFHVVPEKHNDPACCVVEIRGYSGPGRARVRKLSDSELTVILS